jgi:hypothetical protein
MEGMKMKKIETDLEKFIFDTIEQVKSGTPDDCILSDNIYFDVSLLTDKKRNGKIGISLAGIEFTKSSNQVHRVRFAIADKRSREENAIYLKKTMHDIFSEINELAKLDESNKVPKKKRGRQRMKKER